MAEIAKEVNGGDSQDSHSLLSSPARDFFVRNNGEQVKIDSLKGKTIGFYFSAAWCGTCQQFTPQLVEVYNELSPKVGFEIVFVSGDEDEKSFSDYFSKMPWLAVPFTDSETRDRLDELFKVRGIPNLVMVDDHGKTVNENGVGVIQSYGADAYPFTLERMKEIKEEEDRARKDRLSNLPNHLLCLILSKLPTKDSVRTSVLSERWRNLWLQVPSLDLDTTNFRDYYEFLDFTDRFMESNKELDIKRFKLNYDLDGQVHFVWRISKVLKRRVRHLTITSWFVRDEGNLRMLLSIYSCASLVNLSLINVVMDNPESELVSLPCVKKMSLEGVKFNDISILETLISNCPVLEDLVVIPHPNDFLEVVCVRSQYLKSFKLNSQVDDGDPVFGIDAPRLEYMSISNYLCENCIIHRIGPSTEVNIDVVSNFEHLDPLEITRIRDFIIGLSKAREMRISAQSLWVIHDFSNLEPLPQFTNLSFLNVLLMRSWEVLATFLGCCINLQSLVVKLDSFSNVKEIEASPVPQCFRSSLKFVTLQTLAGDLETPITRKVVDYFRQNCSVLEKLVLKVKIDGLKGKKIWFYFSATWCGPCQQFTPQLVEVYNELSPKAGFEIVFLSGDKDEESFNDYFSKMPWLAVPFTDSETRDRLKELFKVRGIPNLVMVDDHGKTVNENGVGVIRSYGADAYPFTPERMKEIKEEEDKARKEQTLTSVLVTPSRDFVISRDGDKVPVSELEGKTIGLLFSVASYRKCVEFTPKLVEVYEKLKENGENFEIVLISLEDVEESFNQDFETKSWLALPFNDKSSSKLARHFMLSALPMMVILGPDGKIRHSNVAEAIDEHGVLAYPFTPEKFEELKEIEKAKMEAQTLESILVSGDLNYVLGKDGARVLVSDLVGKNILMYFSAHWCRPCRAFTPKLVEIYKQIKEQDEAFELIFISSDRDQESFDEYYSQMPWLALPFGDPRISSLAWTFKVGDIPMLAALGPTGRTITKEARSLVVAHGADAYPFTEDRLKEIEAKYVHAKCALKEQT